MVRLRSKDTVSRDIKAWKMEGKKGEVEIKGHCQEGHKTLEDGRTSICKVC